MDRIDQQPEPDSPVPVDTDDTATTPQLLARSSDDYATAQDRRTQLSREDRVNGQHPGGGN